MNELFINVIEKDLCCGCGVCAGSCPSGRLEMSFNSYGEYVPRLRGATDCTEDCHRCAAVCPFLAGNADETALARHCFPHWPTMDYREELGYFSACYVGHAPEFRANGASGGLASWLLATLLERGEVDRVACVLPTGEPDRLFRYRLVTSVAELRQGAGSVYYPVELSEVLRQITRNGGRHAVVGLPCFLKGLRLAMAADGKLRESIPLLLGLVCGQTKGKGYTDFLAQRAGITPPLKGVSYRGKLADRTAAELNFSGESIAGCRGSLAWSAGAAEAWDNQWFTPTACTLCDDVFAEVADVAFMDAWLPEYIPDPRGTSLLLVRSPLINDLLRDGQDINLLPVAPEKLLAAQQPAIHLKRTALAFRLYARHQSRELVPAKRVSPRKPGYFQGKIVALGEEMRQKSRELARGKEAGELAIPTILATLRSYLRPIRRWQRADRLVRLPLRIITRISKGNQT